jgi:hypothetical protein
MTGILEVQINSAASLPVIIIDDVDFKSRETGVAFGSVTCDYAKAGDSALTNYPLSGQWDEIGEGLYEVDFTSSELDTLGLFKYIVYGAGYLPYYGAVNVVDHDPEEAIQDILDDTTAIELDTQSLQGGLFTDVDIDDLYIPTGTTAINDSATMLIGATSVTVDNTSNFESVGVFQVESELVTYTGKTSTTFTGLGRGAYGTSAAAHADNTSIYGANVFRAKISIRDATNTPEAPDSAPTLTIVDIDGNSELVETSMTQDGALVGVYYHNFAILSSQTEEKWELDFKVIDNSLTNHYYRERFITSQPARRADAYGGEGELYCYEDGYYNSSGVYTAWGDDYAGDVTDSETGVAIDDATVTAYRVESGVTIPDMHPPGQTKTKVDGSWIMHLDAGTYTFTVFKAGIIDESFNRTLS